MDANDGRREPSAPPGPPATEPSTEPSSDASGEPSPDPATEPAAEPPTGASTERRDRSEASASWAAWAFGIYVAAAFPLLLFVLGDHYWFLRDDWYFITERELSSPGDLFDDHNGHWSTGPIVVFRVLYALVGLRSYVPYQASVVTAHLVVVVLLRALMRRYQVGPWTATVVAGAAVLFGSGREDIIWAFQVGYTGSIALALTHWLLADHQGPIGRRDVLGVVAGIAAVASASPPIPIYGALAVTLLIRRGWRGAAVNLVPVVGAYLLWSAIVRPDRSSPWGKPPVGTVVDWVTHGQTAVFRALTGSRAAAVALALVLVVGGILAVVDQPVPPSTRGGRRWVTVARAKAAGVAGPVTLFGATFVFIALAAQARWIAGSQAAGASRYLYVYAVLTLPMLGLAASAFQRRWRYSGAVVLVPLVIGMPANATSFEDPPFGPGHHAHQEALIRNAVRSPHARWAPDRLRPDPDVFNSQGLTMGFLRGAVGAGKLRLPTGPIPDPIGRELAVRLALDQQPATAPLERCTPTPADRLRLDAGTRFYLGGDLLVRLVQAGTPVAPTVRVRAGDGPLVTVVRDGVDLEVRTNDGTAPGVCIIL